MKIYIRKKTEISCHAALQCIESGKIPPLCKLKDLNYANLGGQFVFNRYCIYCHVYIELYSKMAAYTDVYGFNDITEKLLLVCVEFVSMGVWRMFDDPPNLLGLQCIYIQDLKNIRNVKGCRDGMPKSKQTR